MLPMLIAAAALVQSPGPPPPERCFEVGQIIRQHNDGDRALIVRTNTDRYYRIGFAAQCPNLLRQDASYTFASRGPNTQICTANDLAVTVTASRFTTPCEAATIEGLSAEQVRALPAKIRP